MTKLYFINFYILQWLFIRLARIEQGNVVKGYKILYGVFPLTGWGTPYKKLPVNGLTRYVWEFNK